MDLSWLAKRQLIVIKLEDGANQEIFCHKLADKKICLVRMPDTLQPTNSNNRLTPYLAYLRHDV